MDSSAKTDKQQEDAPGQRPAQAKERDETATAAAARRDPGNAGARHGRG